MAFESNNFYVAKKVGLPKSEFSVECNVGAGESVVKVLSVSLGTGKISSETLNGVVNFSGSIDVKLVYLTEGGQINTVCSTCPFSSKFENEQIENGQSVIVSVKIIDYNIESIGGESVKLLVNLEQSCFILASKEVKTIRCNDEDVCLKNEDMSIIKYIGSASEDIEITSDFTVRDKINRILLSESSAVVKSVEGGSGFVVISGEVATRVVYLNDNDKFESGYVYDTFKEEIELDGVTRESLVCGSATVKQEGVKCDIVEDEKGSKISINVPVSLNVFAFGEDTISVVKDLYSTKCETKVTTESFDMTYLCPMEMVEGKIEGSLILEDDKPRVDKIIFSGGNSVTITNSYISDGEVFIEGIAKTTVVYLNDEDNALYSVQIDVPFTLSDKFNYQEGGILTAEAVVDDVDVSVRKGRELFYDAKVKINVSYCYNRVSGIISDATAGEDYPAKDYAMEVVFARSGDELWDIAKHSKVKEEQVLSQNSDVIFPLAEDTSLILFYQRIS